METFAQYLVGGVMGLMLVAAAGQLILTIYCAIKGIPLDSDNIWTRR